jgi:hypothetical protein
MRGIMVSYKKDGEGRMDIAGWAGRLSPVLQVSQVI